MKTMDHQQALKIQAAERYLLDELTQEERDDFEEHYFSCVECAEEVRTAFSLADNAKAVLAEAPSRPILVKSQPAKARSSWDWWAGLWTFMRPVVPVAAMLLLAITVYQSVLVIPRLQRELADASAPRVVPTVVAHAATRGDDAVVQVSNQDRLLQLILDINPTTSVSSYKCEVLDGAGNKRFTVPANLAGGGGSVYLLLPAQDLESGRYTIRVRPADASGTSPVDEYRFELQRK